MTDLLIRHFNIEWLLVNKGKFLNIFSDNGLHKGQINGFYFKADIHEGVLSIKAPVYIWYKNLLGSGKRYIYWNTDVKLF
jgi:hypothetical protein